MSCRKLQKILQEQYCDLLQFILHCKIRKSERLKFGEGDCSKVYKI